MLNVYSPLNEVPCTFGHVIRRRTVQEFVFVSLWFTLRRYTHKWEYFTWDRCENVHPTNLCIRSYVCVCVCVCLLRYVYVVVYTCIQWWIYFTSVFSIHILPLYTSNADNSDWLTYVVYIINKNIYSMFILMWLLFSDDYIM